MQEKFGELSAANYIDITAQDVQSDLQRSGVLVQLNKLTKRTVTLQQMLSANIMRQNSIMHLELRPESDRTVAVPMAAMHASRKQRP